MGVLLSPSGVTKPERKDTGRDFFGWIEDLFQKFNDHTHDGSNTNKINSRGVKCETQSVLVADWTGVAPSLTVTKTLPFGMLYDEVVITPCLTTGEQTQMKVTKSSSTAYILSSIEAVDLTVKISS